jgi:hypothetical protein
VVLCPATFAGRLSGWDAAWRSFAPPNVFGGTYGGTKAKPLAAYRRRLCCLTWIKDADCDWLFRLRSAPRGKGAEFSSNLGHPKVSGLFLPFASPLSLLYIVAAMSLPERTSPGLGIIEPCLPSPSDAVANNATDIFDRIRQQMSYVANARVRCNLPSHARLLLDAKHR